MLNIFKCIYLIPTKVCHFMCEYLRGLCLSKWLKCFYMLTCFYVLWYALYMLLPCFHTLAFAFIHFHMLSYAFICFHTFHMLSYAFICFYYALECLYYALECFYRFRMHFKQKCHHKNKKLAAPLYTGFYLRKPVKKIEWKIPLRTYLGDAVSEPKRETTDLNVKTETFGLSLIISIKKLAIPLFRKTLVTVDDYEVNFITWKQPWKAWKELMRYNPPWKGRRLVWKEPGFFDCPASTPSDSNTAKEGIQRLCPLLTGCRCTISRWPSLWSPISRRRKTRVQG